MTTSSDAKNIRTNGRAGLTWGVSQAAMIACGVCTGVLTAFGVALLISMTPADGQTSVVPAASDSVEYQSVDKVAVQQVEEPAKDVDELLPELVEKPEIVAAVSLKKTDDDATLRVCTSLSETVKQRLREFSHGLTNGSPLVENELGNVAEENVAESEYWSEALDDEPDPWAAEKPVEDASGQSNDPANDVIDSETFTAESSDESPESTGSPSPEPISAIVPPLHVPRLDADEMLAHLREDIPQVQFDTKSGSAKDALLRVAAKRENLLAQLAGELPLEQQLMQRLVKHRNDVEGLPFRWGEGCRSRRDSVEVLDQVSLQVRGVRGTPPLAASDVVPTSRDEQLLKLLEENAHWKSPHAVGALEQTLQVECPEVRTAMIEHFATINGPEASRALAHRAVFDHGRAVRFSAIEALRGRPADEYEPLLLEALQHPWDAAAWNAAEALALISDAHLVPELLAALDAPPPSAPQQDEQGDWRIREMVAVGHMQNCVLCHAPSASPDDEVRGLIPNPNAWPPSVYYSGGPQGDFVRADVTYLKQDFSVIQPIDDHGRLPKNQRFDYLVRERKLTQEERLELAQLADERSASHREAVVFLLGQLTGLSVEELRAIHRDDTVASR